jgi:hypothetical protein
MRVVVSAIMLAVCCSIYSAAQLDEVLKKAEGALGQHDTSGLSNDKIVAGLKQALQVSTGKAVAITGKPDGFLKNQAIKILLPPKLETVDKGMRMLGMGSFSASTHGLRRGQHSLAASRLGVMGCAEAFHVYLHGGDAFASSGGGFD